MAYEDTTEVLAENNNKKVDVIIKRYKEAESLKDNWKDKFEEAYEYCLPSRESFYEESAGQKVQRVLYTFARDDMSLGDIAQMVVDTYGYAAYDNATPTQTMQEEPFWLKDM